MGDGNFLNEKENISSEARTAVTTEVAEATEAAAASEKKVAEPAESQIPAAERTAVTTGPVIPTVEPVAFTSDQTTSITEQTGFDVGSLMALDAESSDERLFREIEAFKQKAATISGMVKEKEARVTELEGQLREREAQNAIMQRRLAEIENDLKARHREADGLVSTVELQVDRVLDQLRQEMLMLRDKTADTDRIIEMQEMLEKVSASVAEIKQDLYDKVHDENVKVFRNISDLLDERDKNDHSQEQTQEQFKKVRTKISWVGVFSFLTLGVAVVLLLLQLGIIVL